MDNQSPKAKLPVSCFGGEVWVENGVDVFIWLMPWRSPDICTTKKVSSPSICWEVAIETVPHSESASSALEIRFVQTCCLAGDEHNKGGKSVHP